MPAQTDFEKIQIIPPDLTGAIKYEMHDGTEGGHAHIYKGAWSTPGGAVTPVRFFLRGRAAVAYHIRSLCSLSL